MLLGYRAEARLTHYFFKFKLQREVPWLPPLILNRRLLIYEECPGFYERFYRCAGEQRPSKIDDAPPRILLRMHEYLLERMF